MTHLHNADGARHRLLPSHVQARRARDDRLPGNWQALMPG
jgi:hypothetical protein